MSSNLQNCRTVFNIFVLFALFVTAVLAPLPVHAAAPTQLTPTAAAANGWNPRFGMPGVEGKVTAVAVAANGDVYVGGDFTKAGGMAAQHIARWDGRSWHALGDGINGNVTALAVDGTDLYVGGDFEVAGSVTTNGIARWDGANWFTVGDGTGVVDDYFDTPERGDVYAMLIRDGKLYIGGDFVAVDGITANSVAVWDGTTWQAVGSGIGELDWEGKFVPEGEVYALATDGTTLYAGGEFLIAGDVTANSLAQWDGNSWSALGGGVTMTDGNGHPQFGSVRALAVNGGTLYAGGWFDKAGGNAANHIAQWQNNSWHPLGVGVRAEQFAGEPQVRALAVVDNTLYVGGRFVGAGNQNIDLLAQWANNSWTEVGMGIANDDYDYVNVLTPGRQGDLYMGGAFRIVGDQRVDNIAQWHNDGWRTLGSGLLSIEYGDSPANPYAIATDEQGHIFVGGEFAVAGGVRLSNLAMWDGSRWVAIGNANARVRDMVVADGALYVGGEFTQIGELAASHVARLDLNTFTWSTLGAGINDTVYALDYADGILYAGGAFKSAGTVTAEDVAWWDGAAWHAFGSKARIFEVGDRGGEIGTYVNDLKVQGDSVFIAGHFQVIQYGTNTADLSSFQVVHNVVEWQRSTDSWFYLGDAAQRGVTFNGYSGFSVDANQLAIVGNELYVGGSFNQAGGLAASGLARWDMAAQQWVSLNASLGGNTEEAKVLALAAYGADLFVGGNFLSAGNATVNFVGKLDTATDLWSALDGGVKWYNDRYTEVTALAVDANGVYIGGDFDKAGGLSAPGFAHWRGTLDGGANVTPDAGGVVDGPNGLTVNFPAGAVNQASIVNLALLVGVPQPLPTGQAALYSFRGSAATVGGQPVNQFAKAYTLRVPYTAEQLAALGITDPTQLNLLTWNGTAWSGLLPCTGCTIDTANKTVIVTADHFSDFALVGPSTVVTPVAQQIFLPLVAR
jgi:hypothetical protein